MLAEQQELSDNRYFTCRVYPSICNEYGTANGFIGTVFLINPGDNT